MARKRKDASVNNLDRAAGAMVGIGALNWGLVGLTNMDPVRAIFGKRVARGVYALVGASAAYVVARGAKLASRTKREGRGHGQRAERPDRRARSHGRRRGGEAAVVRRGGETEGVPVRARPQGG